MKVYFLAGAEADLKEMRRYIKQNFGEAVWHDSYQKIKNAVRLLETAPESGSAPEELAEMQLGRYRQFLAGMNRILYEIRDDALYIHIVCDGRRDMKSLLSRRFLRDQ